MSTTYRLNKNMSFPSKNRAYGGVNSSQVVSLMCSCVSVNMVENNLKVNFESIETHSFCGSLDFAPQRPGQHYTTFILWILGLCTTKARSATFILWILGLCTTKARSALYHIHSVDPWTLHHKGQVSTIPHSFCGSLDSAPQRPGQHYTTFILWILGLCTTKARSATFILWILGLCTTKARSALYHIHSVDPWTLHHKGQVSTIPHSDPWTLHHKGQVSTIPHSDPYHKARSALYPLHAIMHSASG